MLSLSAISTRRYRLQHLLGSGSMGEVYCAFDRLTGMTVALKRVLHAPQELSFNNSNIDDLRYALADEFRVLASLRHPHIISVLDYGFDAEQRPYYTMTLLDEPLNIIQAVPSLSFAQRVQAFSQILQALAYLHRRGILHRDLKPGNVLLDRENRVKLVDFGLAAQGGASGISGTLGYMAPEVIQHARATLQSDLYSAGLLGDEIFTGIHPFDLENFSILMHQTLHQMPDMQNVPEALRPVLTRLLMKDPANRYPDADSALADLAQAVPDVLSIKEVTVQESFLQAARFVGRDEELARLTAALDQMIASTREGTKAPSGAAFLVSGEPGTGKSRLLDELRTHALLNGALVLRGQGSAGSTLPFDLWLDVIRLLLLETEVSPLEASILQEIVPDIAVLLQREIPPAPIIASNNAQDRLLDTTLALFRRQTQPTLLILDDLQWAGESLALLQRLLHFVSSAPILVVGSYRHEEAPTLSNQLPSIPIIKLERLNRSEIAELSAAMIGSSGREPNLVEYLDQQSEGNILFLIEVMRALAEGAGDLRNIGKMTLPEQVITGGIERIVQQRLRRIPVEALPTLQLAAVMGRRINVQLLVHLMGVDTERWLQAGMAAAILEVDADQWRFAHDRLRSAVMGTIPEAILPDYHRQIAEGLEVVHAANVASVAHLLYDHWRSANDIEKVAYYGAMVVAQYVFAGFIQDAAKLVEQILALNPKDSAVLVRLYQLAGEIEYDRGLSQTSYDYYSKCLHLAQQMGNLESAGVALEGLGGTAILMSNFSSAQQWFDESLALRRRIGDERGIGNVLHHMSVLQRLTGDYAASEASMIESVTVRRQIQDPHGLAYSLYQMAVHARLRGNYADGIAHLQEAREIQQRIGDGRGLAENLNNLGLCYMLAGELDLGYETLIESLAMRRAVNNVRGIGSTVNALADVQLLRGAFPAAIRYGSEALRIWHGARDQWNISNSYAALGIIQLWQNERFSGRLHLVEALQIARTIKINFILLKALLGWARLHLLDGQPERTAVLLGLIEKHPGLTAQLRDTHFNSLAAAVPSSRYPDAYARGSTADLYQMVQQILKDADREDGI